MHSTFRDTLNDGVSMDASTNTFRISTGSCGGIYQWDIVLDAHQDASRGAFKETSQLHRARPQKALEEMPRWPDRETGYCTGASRRGNGRSARKGHAKCTGTSTIPLVHGEKIGTSTHRRRPSQRLRPQHVPYLPRQCSGAGCASLVVLERFHPDTLCMASQLGANAS
eukprot:6022390-Pleurochrysis_carterae.AAC.1